MDGDFSKEFVLKYLNKLIHTATVWKNPVSDNYGGFTYDSPVLIACRWEAKTELFIDNTGREAVSKAVIFLDLADSIEEGDMIAFGDLKTFTNPYGTVAKIIKSINSTPNLKGTQTAVTAYI